MDGLLSLQMSSGDPTEMTTLTDSSAIRILGHSKSLSHLPKRPPVDIEFSDVSYTVPTPKGKRIHLSAVNLACN